MEFSGIERVDASWVLPAYRRATPPLNPTHPRKQQRHVVQSRLQAAMQGTFSDLELRRFVIRCVRRHGEGEDTQGAVLAGW